MQERGEMLPIAVPEQASHTSVPEVEAPFSRRDGFRALGAVLVQASLPAVVVSKQAMPVAQEVVKQPLIDMSRAVKSARTVVDVADNLPALAEKNVPRRAFLPLVGRLALGKIPSTISKIDRLANLAARSMFPGVK